MEQKLIDAANEPQGFKPAIDKRTGERIYVRPTNDYVRASINVFETSDGRTIMAHALSFEAGIDWQKYRMDVAKSIHRMLASERIDNLNADVIREIAVTAVIATDALIAELKKTEK